MVRGKNIFVILSLILLINFSFTFAVGSCHLLKDPDSGEVESCVCDNTYECKIGNQGQVCYLPLSPNNNHA